jgi:hypothetical protein
MVELTDFAARLYPDVPQVPATYATAAILDSIERFASQTWSILRGMAISVVAADIDSSQNNEVELDIADIVGTTPDYRPVGSTRC